ncbi:Two component transcriptional regulator, LuxR family [Nostocoides japonicum T1-X7]|uniref:Two component transcriptional regulator, LuxR family n=1 Tax=Nostocoides japonicum T1-X7 TaxID=1194083 RepID=A0A077M2M4_9MICO|nr:response regulator transcription factor [Tetrasphaera japonica]CCH78494.1 Two component transcriptional regulator, LuxR family [Tetrasphaera japonica T1-X7]
MRVAICDDSFLFSDGLARLLSAAAVDVPLRARDGQELLARLRSAAEAPDAAIIDIRMQPTYTDEGIRTAIAARSSFPAMGLLVLSTYAETAYAATLLEECASGIGYLLKDRVNDLGVLLDALARVASGGTVIDESIVRRLLTKGRQRNAVDRLTAREREVLEQMALGRSNVGIADELHLSVKTVERHIAHLLQELGLTTDAGDNRRVLAVLEWLRSSSQ